MENNKEGIETTNELTSKLALISKIKDKKGRFVFKIQNTSEKDLFFPFCNFNHALHIDTTLSEEICVDMPEYPYCKYSDFVKIISEYPVDLNFIRLFISNNEQIEEKLYYRSDSKDGSSKTIELPLLIFIDTQQYQDNIVDIMLPDNCKLSKESDLCIDIKAKSSIQILIDLDIDNAMIKENLIKLQKLVSNKSESLEVIEIKNTSDETVNYDFSFFEENNNKKIETRFMGFNNPTKDWIKDIIDGRKDMLISRLYCNKDSAEYFFNNQIIVEDKPNCISKKIYLDDFKKSNHFQGNIIDFLNEDIININCNSKTKKLNFNIPPKGKIILFVIVE